MSMMLLGEPVVRLRRELHEQELMLRGVITRLVQARNELVPPEHGVDWRGPAQLVYSVGLGRLRVELQNAESRLDDALRETRLAIASLDNRGG